MLHDVIEAMEHKQLELHKQNLLAEDDDIVITREVILEGLEQLVDGERCKKRFLDY